MLDLGKRQEAEKLLENALTVDAHHPQATFNLGLLHWRDAKITDVDFVTAMEEMRKSHEGNPEAALLLARVHAERGDPYQGIQVLEAFEKAAWSTEEIRTELMRMRERGGEPDKVVALSKSKYGYFSGEIAMSQNGAYVVWNGATGGHIFEVYDTVTGCVVRSFDDRNDTPSGGLTKIFLSDDGCQVVTGHRDGGVYLWDTETNKLLRKFEGHTKLVESVYLSMDGQYLLSGSWDGTSRLWNARTGRLLRMLDEGADVVFSVCLSGDGRYAVTGGTRSFRLWDVKTGRLVQTFLSPENMEEQHATVVQVSHGGEKLLSGDSTGQVRLWQAATGRCAWTFTMPSIVHYRGGARVSCLHITHDSRYAWCGSEEGRLVVLDVSSGRCVRTLLLFKAPEGVFLHNENARSEGAIGHELVVSKDGGYVLHKHPVLGGRILSLGRGRSQQSPFALSRVVASERSLAVESMSNQYLAAAGDCIACSDFVAAAANVRKARSLPGSFRLRETLRSWTSLYLRLPRKELRGGWPVAVFRGHTSRVVTVSLSRYARFGLSRTEYDLGTWDLETGQCVHELKEFESKNTGISSRVAPSDDGNYLVLLNGHNDATVPVYDIRTRTYVEPCERSRLLAVSQCTSHDGQYLLRQTNHPNNNIPYFEIMHAATGKCLRRFDGPRGYYLVASMSHNGRFVLWGCTGRLDLYDLAEGRSVRRFDLDAYFHSLEAVFFNGTSRTAWVAGHWSWNIGPKENNRLALLDIHDGSVLSVIPGISDLRSLNQFTQDGHHAVTFLGSRLLVWDLRSGECIHTFHLGSGDRRPQPWALCISPDGRYVMTGHNNGESTLWVLDWELEDRQPADWDDGATDYLQVFLDQHVPYAGEIPTDREPTEEEITLALTRRGKPVWTEDEFKRLLHTLGCVGYGWLRPEGVRKQLEAMARQMPEERP